MDASQFAGGLGFQIPFSGEQSSDGWMSAHVSYEACPWFIPLVQFEGGDLFNLGAVNSDENRDFVSMAFGFRSRITDNVDIGAAYEIPLTNEDNSLMESRVTVDLVWKF